jgi:hypothetical protein
MYRICRFDIGAEESERELMLMYWGRYMERTKIGSEFCNLDLSTCGTSTF